MIDTAIYYSGYVAFIAGGGVIVAALLALSGLLVGQASVDLFRKGLMFIRLCNWYYWNERMAREGLISMQTFYREQVAIHKPKTLDDFNAIDMAARAQEQAECVAECKQGGAPAMQRRTTAADPVEAELLTKALFRESDGAPMNKAARDLLKHWGEHHAG